MNFKRGFEIFRPMIREEKKHNWEKKKKTNKSYRNENLTKIKLIGSTDFKWFSESLRYFFIKKSWGTKKLREKE
jgi:hypothetical protein